MKPLPYPWRIGAAMLFALYLPNMLQGGADPRQWPPGLWLWWLVPWGVWLVGAMVLRVQILRTRRQRAQFMAAMAEMEKSLAEHDELKAILDRCPDHVPEKALDRPPLL